MQCDQCNHSLSEDKKRNILALYPQKGKVDMVCMFVGPIGSAGPGGHLVMSGWRSEQGGLSFCAASKFLHDENARLAFESASKVCPIDVVMISQGIDSTNFQYVTSMIKAVRAAHPKICVFLAGADKKLSVNYRGDETEEEKSQVFFIGNSLVRDLDIAVSQSQ